MKAIYKLVYNKRNKLDEEGKAYLHLEVYWNRGTRRFISTKIQLKEDEWDDAKKLIKPRHSNYIELNLLLKKQIQEIENYELSLLNSGLEFTPELLDQFIDNNLQKLDFLSFYKMEIDKKSVALILFFNYIIHDQILNININH